MPDRLPQIDPAESEPRSRRRGAARPRASRDEAFAVVERAARMADGLAVLERAPLECAAVLLGVDPGAVECVRVALDDRALREEAILRFVSAAAGRRAPAKVAAPAPAPRDPEALLAAARQRDGGVAILLDASPECAAIVFGVHPDLVHRARAVAARGGAASAR
ncbi:MAG TPA: hypothetical protein VFL83_22635 [Anaeromyxobacter sp.]|nr:hypothetical protein [Anaeromyxobacter sp.]